MSTNNQEQQPLSFKLFGPDQSKWIKFNPQEKVLMAPNDQSWASIGIDHAIDPQKTTSFEVMPICLRDDHYYHFSVGIASKGVINTPGYTHIGHFMEGWDYYCSGTITSDHQHVAPVQAVALHQLFKLELSKFTMNIFIKGHKVASRDLRPFFEKHKDTTFYFGVSMAGKGEKVKIIDFTTEK